MARLNDKLFGEMGKGESGQSEGKLLRYAIKDIEELREAAFASFFQQPVVQALMLPTGGLGGLAILERLSSH